MFISDNSVKYKTTVFVLTAIIIIAGMSSYFSLPRESAPEIVIPNVFIQTNYRGVSPEDMESSVTKEIEDKLKGLKDVKKISSTSKEGSSLINIEFVTGVDIDDALQKVKDKVDLAKADLPTDLDDDPSVFEVNFSEMPILIFALSGNCGKKKLRDIAEDIEDDIEGIPGVLGVDLSGGVIREIHIEVSPSRMAVYGVPFSALRNVISGENANISGGSIKTGEGKYQLRIEGEFKSAAEAENIIIMTNGSGAPIYLRDIAKITDGFKDANDASRLDGAYSINILVRKRAGENIIKIVDKAKALLASNQPNWPKGTKITYLMDGGKEIHAMVADLENNIISGLILVIVVVCLAMGFRNAIIVSLSIPLSMLLGFIIIKALGITLNMVVLFSLTLALGMLVDNAIVITENIYRFMQEGVPRAEAAMKATSEVAYPIIGSALTTIAAFAPLVFWGGVMGGFMSFLPKTVIIVLGSCLFVALVINPALASIFMAVKKVAKSPKTAEEVMSGGERSIDVKKGSKVISIYHRILSSALGVDIPKSDKIDANGFVERYSRHFFALAPKFAVLVFSGLFFVLMYYFWFFVIGVKTPVEFFPNIDPKRVSVSIDFPEGVDLAYCNKISSEIEKCVYDEKYFDGKNLNKNNYSPKKIFKDKFGVKYQSPSDIPNIDSCYTSVISIGGKSEVSFGFLEIQRRTERSPETIKKIEERLTNIAGAKITLESPKEGPPTGAPINIEIVGDDMDVLGRKAKEIEKLIRKVPYIKNIKNNSKQGSPTLSIKVDRKRAALVGLNSSAIGYVIKSAINGTIISTYREGDDEFDIVMRAEALDRRKIETLDRLFLPTRNHGLIPLTTLVDISYSGGFGSIERIDHERVVTVKAEVDTKNTTGETAKSDAEKILQTAVNEHQLILPPGYSYRFTGEEENKKESEEFLAWAGSIAVALIFMVLVSQFNSVLYPFIILSSVILSLAGVFLGLGVCGLPFGIIMTGVGVISLAGVVVNNAIVLIDYIIKLRNSGMERDQAILQAGVTRLRPVLLTAITTMLGLIPMATGYSFDFHLDSFGFQAGSESSQWWVSMAVAVIFGLGVATMLTLIVVPVLFSLFDDLHNLGLRLFDKLCKKIQNLQIKYWLYFYNKSKITPNASDPYFEEYNRHQ